MAGDSPNDGKGELIDDSGSDVKKGFSAGIPTPKPNNDSLKSDTVVSRSSCQRDTLGRPPLDVNAKISTNPAG
jgi:hypothetical protein